MDTIWQDLKYAARSLSRTPGFTITAALTLALGIGATTAIFSVFDVVLLRPLPYRDADRLYVIHEAGRTGALIPANALHFREWRGATRSFEEMALIGPAFAASTLAGIGEPTRVNVARTTPSLFRLLGVEPALGRAFLEEEDVPGRDGVVILGHDIWTTHFGSDPAIIGRSIRLNDAPAVVVGVLPAGFSLPKLSHFYALETSFEQPQIWKPFAATPRDLRLQGSFNYVAIGRVKPGISASQALDDLNAVQADLTRQAPAGANFRAALVPIADQIASRSRTALQLVLGAVTLVLLIACVNITNLLLARGGRRQREFAIRRAAGAQRLQLVSQMLVESLVLSALAGIVGLVVGVALVRLIQLYAPVNVPRIDEVTIGLRVVLFTFGVTLVSGLLIGLLPAWRSTRGTPVDLLRSASVTATSGARSGRLRSLLVGVEVAASLVCLVAGALLVSSFINLLSVERGFDTERVVTVDLTLSEPRYDRLRGVQFLSALTERVRALPGVSSVGVTDVLPLSGVSNSAIMVEGTNLPRPERPAAMIRFADPGYFQTLGIAPQVGRLLEETDGGRRVAVVSALTARRLWPQQNAVGKRFRYGPDDAAPFVEVVGVVGDLRSVSLSENPPLNIYLPTADYFYGVAALAVKTTSDPEAVAGGIRTILRELDPTLALPTPRTMDDIVAQSVAARRFQMNLVILLAAAAAFLAGLGIYAVVSQAATQRTSEFGIRMSLGANASNIRRLVVQQGMLPVVLGLGAGIVASVGIGRFLRTLLFGVSPTDIVPFAVACVFLVGVALMASLIPARRAARMEPLVALRTD